MFASIEIMIRNHDPVGKHCLGPSWSGNHRIRLEWVSELKEVSVEFRPERQPRTAECTEWGSECQTFSRATKNGWEPCVVLMRGVKVYKCVTKLHFEITLDWGAHKNSAERTAAGR